MRKSGSAFLFLVIFLGGLTTLVFLVWQRTNQITLTASECTRSTLQWHFKRALLQWGIYYVRNNFDYLFTALTVYPQKSLTLPISAEYNETLHGKYYASLHAIDQQTISISFHKKDDDKQLSAHIKQYVDDSQKIHHQIIDYCC